MVSAEADADAPLDWPQSCGKLDVGPRKLRTIDGQASDAEILGSAPGRVFLDHDPLLLAPAIQIHDHNDAFPSHTGGYQATETH